MGEPREYPGWTEPASSLLDVEEVKRKIESRKIPVYKRSLYEIADDLHVESIEDVERTDNAAYNVNFSKPYLEGASVGDSTDEVDEMKKIDKLDESAIKNALERRLAYLLNAPHKLESMHELEHAIAQTLTDLKTVEGEK